MKKRTMEKLLVNNGDSKASHGLFGEALSCFIPKGAIDVSQMREIPDNQEVFCHKATDQSLMVDLLEYQEHVSGEDAARYHFSDLVETNDAGQEHEITLVETIPHSTISLTQCSECWYLAGRLMVSKFKEDPTARNLIEIHLILYRLPQFKTDILLVLNSPIAISKESSSSSQSSPNCVESWTLEMFKKVGCSVKLNNPGIFG